MISIQERIITAYDNGISDTAVQELFEVFIDQLDRGCIRAVSYDNGEWSVNSWVKKGILLGFRIGRLVFQQDGLFGFCDKGTYPVKQFLLTDAVRVVPGGTSVRRGAYCAPGIVIMPPSYINVGAYVDAGTMIDSHVLIGSCAQIGKRCHISAGVQVGGVLEPIQGSPVIIEDEVFIGGQCGIYEGVVVRGHAVLATGTILTASTVLYDAVHERIIRPDQRGRLIVPEGAVVVPGSRPVHNEFGKTHGLAVYTPIIVKYRDEKTDVRVALEEGLR